LLKPHRMLAVVSALSISLQGLQVFGADSAETAAKPASARVEPAVKTAAAGTAASVPASVAKPKGSYIKEEPLTDPAGTPTRVHRPGSDSGDMPPTAPALNSSLPLLKTPPPPPVKEKFPSVGQLEQLMFGHSTPNIAVEGRLDKLETAIFQRDYPDVDVEQRIRRLKSVIVGEESAHPASDPTAMLEPGLGAPRYTPRSAPTLPDLGPDPGSAPSNPASQGLTFPNYGHFDMKQQLSLAEAEKFGLDVINEIRAQQGVSELAWDDIAAKVASEQVSDLVKRETVSHVNAKGHNPDVRYTFAGGTDALVENTIMLPAAENLKPTRELVVKVIESLLTRQDDRESLLFGHANAFAMSLEWTANRQKLICCTEVVSKHGQMEAIPMEAAVGDKIEIKGNVAAPYNFHKISIAWEGLNSAPPADDAESTDALPYFPPLDYEAHATKSNKDFSGGIRFLQIAGITAAIAGGVFIPPVALAAPLIAASVGTSTPKPVSEIPMKGGVKSDGSNFTHKLVLNNQGKEGIYYVTIWASNGDQILPVSRRAIIAHKNSPAPSSKDSEGSKDEPKGDEKHASN
jgi:uncharacterized protein YkwD